MNQEAMSDEQIERQAKRRVDLKMGWLVHALVFVLVNAGLWLLSQWGHWNHGLRWGFFPLWGWGLGLAIHGVVVFFSLTGDGMRERMLDAERQRLRDRR